MAFTAAANATQRVGNYAPGSLAAQPRRFAGGVRKRGESPDQMANRMDAGYMASATQGGTSATTPTRADNIAKARADGTFDAKRNAFNAANSGSFMDAAGNIGPKAEMPAPASPTPVNTVTPPTQTTGMSPRDMDAKQAKNAAVQKRAAQDRNYARSRVASEKKYGPITGADSAMFRERSRKSGVLDKRDPETEKVLAEPPASPSPRLPVSPSPGLRPPVTRTAGGELVQPGNAMNPNARYGKPAAAPAAPAMAPAAPAPATSITTADKVWAKTQKTMRPTPMSGPGAPTLEGRAQSLQDAARLSQATQGPMPRVSTTSAMPAKFVAPAGGFSPEFHRQFDPVPTAPQPAVAPATPPAVPPAKVTPPASTPPAPRLDAAKPAGIVAAASTKAPANGFSPEFHRRFDPTPASTPYSGPMVRPSLKKKPAGFMAAASMN